MGSGAVRRVNKRGPVGEVALGLGCGRFRPAGAAGYIVRIQGIADAAFVDPRERGAAGQLNKLVVRVEAVIGESVGWGGRASAVSSVAKRGAGLADIVINPLGDGRKAAREGPNPSRAGEPSGKDPIAGKPGGLGVEINLCSPESSGRYHVDGGHSEHEIGVVPGLSAASHHVGDGALGPGGVIDFDSGDLVIHARTGNLHVIAGAIGFALVSTVGRGAGNRCGGCNPERIHRISRIEARARDRNGLRATGGTIGDGQTSRPQAGCGGSEGQRDGATGASRQALTASGAAGEVAAVGSGESHVVDVQGGTASVGQRHRHRTAAAQGLAGKGHRGSGQSGRRRGDTGGGASARSPDQQ